MPSLMKKFSFILIALTTLLSCGEKGNFTISGQLKGGEGKIIYLNKMGLSEQMPTDSIKLGKDGSFKFKGKASTPTFYLLRLSQNSYITLLVDSTENVKISGSYNNFTSDYNVKGSIGSEIIQDLDNRLSNARIQIDVLQKQYGLGKTVESAARYNEIITGYTNYATAFVKRNPFSLSSVYALYQKWDDHNFVITDLQTMKIAASALYSIYPNNELVAALYTNTLQFIKQEQNKQVNEAMKQMAINSPNIILPDINGQKRELWSLHGKYTLLHFWSAKDRASRILNPVLSELYQRYKSRGFELFMVSIDQDKSEWLNAIEEDHLAGIQVGDMKGSYLATTSYNIQKLPYNYLLDKEGNIIAKNLKGPALNQTLSEIFR